jgi:ATP-dependent DNA helicase RecQ
LFSDLDASELDESYELNATWELPFWKAAHSAAPRAAKWLIPQAPLEALVGRLPENYVGRRWVDFLYAPPGKRPVVFEIDGRGHERRPQADAARDRELAGARIKVVRASGPEALDRSGALLDTLIGDDSLGTAPDLARAQGCASTAHRFAIAIVEAVELGLLAKGGPWSIEVADPDDVVDELAGPALDPLRAVSELWGLGVVPSTVQVNDRIWHLSASSSKDAHRFAKRKPAMRVLLEPRTPYFARLQPDTDFPTITVRPAGVPVDVGWLPRTVVRRRSMPLTSDTDTHLRLLVEDIYGHDGFRDGQLPALKRTLSGGDSVVLLPTGTGKSLIYQLAGLLTPGTTIVVDPLVSLIDDQEVGLKSVGIDRVAAIHSSRAGGRWDVDKALADLGGGGSLFVFATPERFQSQKFRDLLRSSAKRQLINLVVIDEAHTVSEWGHDFRTSYLHLARNVRRLCADDESRPPPLLALTGTAGPAVLRDVLRELDVDGTDPEALQRPATHNRPNLHFLKISGPDSDWLSLVERAILEVIPSSLALDVRDLGRLDGEATSSGIIFCPWATNEHGVDRVRDAVVDALARAGASITARVYSGRSSSSDDDAGWAKEKAHTAAAFKANEVALLVATKAFGMGIDKPNIRYTIHAGFPSSIEGFAQEAGRAGRDGRDSYCVLTAALPPDDVARELLDVGLTQEMRRLREQRTPQSVSGDLGRQLFFYGGSFPGATEEAERAMRLFVWLKSRGGSPRGRAVISIAAGRGEDRKKFSVRKAKYDRAFYRLALVGVIDDLTIEGPEHTVHFSDYDRSSVDHALLDYLGRIEPGNEAAHRSAVVNAPDDFDERIESHLHTLADAVYRIVGNARLTALQNIYDLARGPDDPEHLRSRINAYLGDGAAAIVLAEGVAMSPIDIPRFVAMLDSIPAVEIETLTAAVARQREAYPDHPLLWMATSLGVAREPGADKTRFDDSVRRSLQTLSRYSVSESQAAVGMAWLIDHLRTENGGARWSWAADVFDTWDATNHDPDLLASAEDDALALARKGRYDERELATVLRRRLRRHGSQSNALAARYASNSRAKEAV